MRELIPVFLPARAARASRFRIGTHSKRFAILAAHPWFAKRLECGVSRRFRRQPRCQNVSTTPQPRPLFLNQPLSQFSQFSPVRVLSGLFVNTTVAALGPKMPRGKCPRAKNSQYSQYSQWSQWSICPSPPFMLKLSPMDAQRSAGSRAGATPRAAKRRLFWSAPAERTADGALDPAGRAGTAGAARAKAVSRFACHRTPETACPRRVDGPLSLAPGPSAAAPPGKANRTESNQSNQKVQRGGPAPLLMLPPAIAQRVRPARVNLGIRPLKRLSLIITNLNLSPAHGGSLASEREPCQLVEALCS